MPDIKSAIAHLNAKELQAMLLRLARYKHENKELLGYLLFDAQDPDTFVKEVKHGITSDMVLIDTTKAYLAKKSIRKVLRGMAKYSRFMASKQADIEMQIHFLIEMEALPRNLKRLPAIEKIVALQTKKANTQLNGLHEDLQYDYRRMMQALETKDFDL